MANNQPHQRVIAVRATHLGPREARALLAEAKLALRENAGVVILDLTKVVQIDSLGVAAIAAVVEAAPAHATVIVAGATPYVMRVIHMTRLHEVVDIYASVDAATRALAA